MARKLPDIEHIPDVEFKRKDDVICQERQYQLITPLYGGGAEPNRADPISVVRGTEVRGHLRFWWRATQLGRFSSLSELRKAEEQLWGSSEVPSSVTIAIRDFSYEKEEYAYEVKSKDRKAPKPHPSNYVAAYAAFPLQPEKEDVSNPAWEPAKILIGTKFTLVLEYPKHHQKEISDCLWAWETFGGIGARTRRGFGALSCPQNEKINQRQFRDWLGRSLEKHVVEVNKPIIGVPYLSLKLDKYACTSSSSNAIQSWKKIIQLLQKFRQDDARYNNKFGLSQWPEANAIREILGKEAKHPKDNKNPKIISKFPRAKFGLPILFHLPHDKKDDKSIPETVTLYGKQLEDGKWIERMASPLILRPIDCIEGSIGLAAVLQWRSHEGDETYTPPGGLKLKGAPGDPEVKSDLNREEVSELPMLNQSDVLAEFLNYVKTNGGKKQ